MDETTIRRLVALNNQFYEKAAPSFSATRHGSWPGWNPLVDSLVDDLPGKCLSCPDAGSCNHAVDLTEPVSVLDVACGNMRFEAYLEGKLPAWEFDFHAIDSCTTFELQDTTAKVSFKRLDVLESVMAGTLEHDLGVAECTIAVCLAFLHHVPTQALRIQLLQVLLNRVRRGGLVAVSLWTFMNDPELAARAAESTSQATAELQLEGLDPGDCLLGWQNDAHLWRYCHSFDEEEIDELAGCLEPDARAILRFSSDGRTESMNTYLVFQRS